MGQSQSSVDLFEGIQQDFCGLLVPQYGIAGHTFTRSFASICKVQSSEHCVSRLRSIKDGDLLQVCRIQIEDVKRSIPHLITNKEEFAGHTLLFRDIQQLHSEEYQPCSLHQYLTELKEGDATTVKEQHIGTGTHEKCLKGDVFASVLTVFRIDSIGTLPPAEDSKESDVTSSAHNSVDSHAFQSKQGSNTESLHHGIPADTIEGRSAASEGASAPRAPRRRQQSYLQPALSAWRSPDGQRLYLLFRHAPHRLADLLSFSPASLADDTRIRLLLYQVIFGLHELHSAGLWHGRLLPRTVLLGGYLHVWLAGACFLPCKTDPEQSLAELTAKWHSWEMSTFDYLMQLNHLAGRRMGDPAFHPILPWVIDMSVSPLATMHLTVEEEPDAPGWRDLTKSQWRLSKGDEQLDFTYSNSDTPHHISDEALSELAYCIYKARRLPVDVLTRVVRAVFEPNEYPASILRLYEWTPDEGIPEFFDDPDVFRSMHPSMADLAVPAWSTGPEHFVECHRAALESERVSSMLHHWIDLTFGYKLTGEAAVAAKNVALPPSSGAAQRLHGRAQLFDRPHPPRGPRPGQVMSLPVSPSKATVRSITMLEQLEGDCGMLALGSTGRAVAAAESSSAGPAQHSLHADRIDEDSRLLYMQPQHSAISAAAGQCSESSHENDGSPADVGGGNKLETRDDERRRSHSLASAQAQDVAAVGALVVQLYTGRLHHVRSTDVQHWQAEVRHLPSAARRIAACCLGGVAAAGGAPSTEELLRSEFFPDGVRAAERFLRNVQPDLMMGHRGCRDAGSDQQSQPGDAGGLPTGERRSCAHQLLRELARSGGVQKLHRTPGALQLCLPIIIELLESAAMVPQHSSEADGSSVHSGSSITSAYVAVLQQLLHCLPKGAVQECVPLWQGVLRGEPSRSSSYVSGGASWVVSKHIQAALLQHDLLRSLLASVGITAFLDSMQPCILDILHDTSSTSQTMQYSISLVKEATQALVDLAASLPRPIVTEHILRPLLLSLPQGPNVTLAAISLGNALGSAFVAAHMLPALLAVLACRPSNAPTTSETRSGSMSRSEEGQQGQLAAAALNALTTLEGLLPALGRNAILRPLLAARPASGDRLLPAPLLGPLLCPHPQMDPLLRNRIAGLVLQACNAAGGAEVLTMEVLPQLLPIFTCSAAQRHAYGCSIPFPPQAAAAEPPPAKAGGLPPPNADSSDATALQRRISEAISLAAGPGSLLSGAQLQTALQQRGGRQEEAEDGGYWDLVYLLYPEAAEAAGLGLLHELVSSWPLIERTLAVRYGWAPTAALGPQMARLSERAKAATLRDCADRIDYEAAFGSEAWHHPDSPAKGEARRAEQTAARLINDIGWSTPLTWPSVNSSVSFAPSTAGPRGSMSSPGDSPAAAGVLLRPAAQESAAVPRGSEWLWLPGEGASDWMQPETWSSAAGSRYSGGDARFWARTWRLQARVVHAWRAHREGMRACAAAPSEDFVVSAGRAAASGGREGDVLRVWDLATSTAGVQYLGHEGAVTALCILPGAGAQLVASCDTSGSCHVWSAMTGTLAQHFCEPAPGQPAWQSRPRSTSRRRAIGWTNFGAPTAGPESGEVQAAMATREAAARPGSAVSSTAALAGLQGAGSAAAPAAGPSTSTGAAAAIGGGGGGVGSASPRQPPSAGYTCITTATRDGATMLVAGTTDGRLRWLDLECSAARADLYCRPLSRRQDLGASAVAAVQQGGGGSHEQEGWLAAGLAGGHAAVVDARCGELCAFWQAHEVGVSAVACCAQHMLLTGSQDQTLKLWDVRMLPSGTDTMGLPGVPRCLHTFEGHRDVIGGVLVQGLDAVSFAGQHLGVFSLQAPYSERIKPVRLQGAKGAKESGLLVTLDILPESRLLVAGMEDGFIKVCM